MIVLYILLIFLALYVLFILIPSLLLFQFVFSRHPSTAPLEERQLKGTRYEPYSDVLVPAVRFLEALPYEKAEIVSHDGLRLRGRYIGAGSDKTIVFCHGYRGTELSNTCAQARWAYEKGYNILLICMRAHGESEGKRPALGMLERYDIARWADYAAEKDGVKSVALYGVSMGAAAVGYASELITNPKVKALVIDCAFASPKKQLDWDGKIRHVPYPLVLPIIRICAYLTLHEDIYYKVGDALKNCSIPALFIHGTEDMTVPFEQGRANYDACASEKEFIAVEGADHIIAYTVGGEKTKRKLNDFLESHL